MGQIKNISLSKNIPPAKAARERLGRAIPFLDEELAMNDDGFFSEAQKLRLKPKTDLYIALCSISAFMAFVIAMVCFFFGRDSDEYVFTTGVFVALFGICFFGISWSLALAKQVKRG